MRMALMSDIHGNFVAMEAVLKDIDEQGGADIYMVLGDLVVQGPNPIEVLERLISLPNVLFVRGNTDREVATGRWPSPSLEDAQKNPKLIVPLLGISQTFAWTHGALVATRWIEWVGNLALEQRLVLPDRTRLLAVHASPGRDDGPGVRLDSTDEELLALVRGCEADLIFVGHTHWPCERRLRDLHVVNIGSVSNHISRDLRASYMLLDADNSGYRLLHRWVDYDREKAIDAIFLSGHPVRDYIVELISQGEPWPFRMH